MSDSPATAGQTPPKGLIARVKDFVAAFTDLRHLPRAFWVVNLFWMIESIGYFGILTLMDVYLPRDIGVSDWIAGLMIAFFTGLVTLFMIGLGGLAEKLGVRYGLLLAVVLCLSSRIAYSTVPLLHLGVAASVALILASLFVTAIGEGMAQPVSYAGVKYYTDEKTSSMGYGLLYALMNAGIFLIGWISPLIRVPVDHLLEARAKGEAEPPTMFHFFADWGISGVNAVNWTCAAITAFSMIFLLVLMTKRAEAQRVRATEEKSAEEKSAEAARPWSQRAVRYFTEGPFSQRPLRVLHLHAAARADAVRAPMADDAGVRLAGLLRGRGGPHGVDRQLDQPRHHLLRRADHHGPDAAGERVHADDRRLGSCRRCRRSSSCVGPHISILIIYFVLFSIGEALWSPRFLQYAAELAPTGKVAQYMGLANVPWLLAKVTTGSVLGLLPGALLP